ELSGGEANAQQSNGANSDLPPVVVNAPKARGAASVASKPAARAASSGASRRTPAAVSTADASSSAPMRHTHNVKPGQDPRGPINGYVATRSMTATKTNTSLM